MLFLQGLILMAAGMGLVVLFLSLLVGVMTLSAKIIPRFNHILPDELPRTRAPKSKAPPAGIASDAEIAVAIAAVAARQRDAEKAEG